MPPRSESHHASSNDTFSPPQSTSLDDASTQEDLLSLASAELELMRSAPNNERSFPPACLRYFHSTQQQNHLCVDCGSGTDVTWASVSYGCTFCLSCSGRHRGLGVRCSYVKSLTLDSWNHCQVSSKSHELCGQIEMLGLKSNILQLVYSFDFTRTI